MGVSITPVSNDAARTFKMKDARGALIVDVTAGSPAEKAGLKPEDVVVAVDGRPIVESAELSRYVASKAPGTTVRLDVLRDGSEKTISFQLGEFREDAAREDAADQSGGEQQLGMSLRSLTPEMAEQLEVPRGTRGVVVTDVEGGAAEQANLRQGDVILSVNGTNVESVDAFRREIERAKSDGVARLRVRRGGALFFAFIRLK
jgi:serine protease Do